MSKKKPLPYLGRTQVIKLGRLLHMYYKPTEIAEIIGVGKDTVRRSYLQAGCPHIRDEKGRIWIDGKAFREWAEKIIAIRKRKKNKLMKQDEAWCMKCRKPVRMENPAVIHKNYCLELLSSSCPYCGSKVNRARGRTNDK